MTATQTCPACNGDGWTVDVEATHGCEGTDEVCSRVCPVAQQVQVGCGYCGGTGQVEDALTKLT